MQVIFCTECGAKNEYSGSKPKFCSSCGTPMGGDKDEVKPKESKKPKTLKAKSLVFSQKSYSWEHRKKNVARNKTYRGWASTEHVAPKHRPPNANEVLAYELEEA